MYISWVNLSFGLNFASYLSNRVLYIYILIIIYYMSVRPSEIIVTRNHFNEVELAPSCERGRLEKGSLLFLIILHFTPLLSPPLLLPLLKI